MTTQHPIIMFFRKILGIERREKKSREYVRGVNMQYRENLRRARDRAYQSYLLSRRHDQ